jgi:hypothetical protein
MSNVGCGLWFKNKQTYWIQCFSARSDISGDCEAVCDATEPVSFIHGKLGTLLCSHYQEAYPMPLQLCAILSWLPSVLICAPSRTALVNFECL